MMNVFEIDLSGLVEKIKALKIFGMIKILKVELKKNIRNDKS